VEKITYFTPQKCGDKIYNVGLSDVRVPVAYVAHVGGKESGH
jgi:hypothetical protein